MHQLDPIQLDFFLTEEECEMRLMRETIEKVRLSNDRVRKKLFAENGKLRGGFEDLSRRLEIIDE